MTEGNYIAYAMIFLWPIITIWLYKTKPIQVATLWTIVGGYMFLPVRTSVELPMIPSLGKDSIPIISALLGIIIVKSKRISIIRELGRIKYLVVLFLIVPLMTSALNSDVIITGGRFIPGLTYYDGLSFVINQLLLIMPFFIGRQLFKTYDDQLTVFKLLVVYGLLYSFLMLFEVRMSPQLHTWIYGYFPHSFAQQIRFGGFRPVVFMGHGLLVSFFAAVVLLAATALWKNRVKIRQFSPATVTYYLMVVLVLCKSIASLFYGLFAFLVIFFINFRTQHRIAILLVCVTMLYPVMSIMKVLPHQTVVNVATSISEDRAASLQFRFDNEEKLLIHARERLLFGWGGWGRNRVFNEETGIDETVTDGRWIITFGQFGVLGFIAEFGLLSITVFRAKKASLLLKSKPEKTLLAAHALLIGIIMLDQLPNSSLAPWLWLLAGILLGRSEAIINQYKRANVNGEVKVDLLK